MTTDREQIIALAEKCGFSWLDTHDYKDQIIAFADAIKSRVALRRDDGCCEDWRNEMNYPKRSRAVSTVGGLIKQLEKLPKNMPVVCGFSKQVVVQVYNYNDSARDMGLRLHCEVVEADQ